MDTLAYLHLAWVCEQPPLALNPRLTVQSKNVLTLAFSLALLGSAQSAFAAPEQQNLQIRAIESYYKTLYPSTEVTTPTPEVPCTDPTVAPQSDKATSISSPTQKPLKPFEAGPMVPPSPTRTAQQSFTGTVLQRGDSGESVRQLQEKLAEAGFFQGPVTGVFGSITEAAVKSFQQAQGLTPDGVYGAQTQARLEQPTPAATVRPQAPVAASGTVLRRGDQSPAVTDLQNALRTAGFYDGPVTGLFGSLTEAALIRFQQAQGLTADGIAGSATLAALQRPAIASNPNRVNNPLSILELQKRLQAKGFYQGALDGIWGPQTEAAIAAAQRHYGISETDIRGGRF